MKIQLIFSLLFSINIVIGQVMPICGTDVVMKKYREHHSNNTKNTVLNHNNEVLEFLDTKIIPVIFHIIHDGHPVGEDENISIAQIEDAIRIMNEDFNVLNEDLENVIIDFENIIGNPNIEFKLAKLDPSGNCINGINRVLSDLTNQANDCVKTIVSWDDTKYLNIWVVEDIDANIGAAAYTYLPGSWIDGGHGIIINHEYVGSIGTSNNTPYKRHTLTHEVGHFLNLEHTWGYGSNGASDNCSNDDDVSDTPNTIGAYSTCNLSQESCGSLDNIQNFMDYASCTCMFTNGQVSRMQNTLNSSVSGRNNLWTNNNLWETGTHDDYDVEACAPNVDFFISSVDRICVDKPTTFLNNSESLGENPIFSWFFVGGNVEFSSEENPTITYSNPGEYEIILNIINDVGENNLTKTYTVYDSETTLEESFESNQFPLNNDANLCWSIDAPNDETSWIRTYLASTQGVASVRIRSRYFDCNRKHILYTPNLNLTNYGLGGGEPLKLWFDLAYAKRNNQTDDLLIVSYSKNCGETWQIRASWNTDELITNNGSTVGNNFIPDNNEWIEKSVNIQAAAEEEDVIIRFEFSGDRGSYLYIDNVRLTGEWININEHNISINEYVIKKIDLLGRENNNAKLYFEIYNTGKVNKKYEF